MGSRKIPGENRSPRPSDNHSFQVEPTAQPAPEEKKISYKAMCYNNLRDIERRMQYVERLYAECYPEAIRQGNSKFRDLHNSFYVYKERSENQMRQLKRRIHKVEESINHHSNNISRLQNEVLYNEKLYTQRMKQVTYCSYFVASCVAIWLIVHIIYMIGIV